MLLVISQQRKEERTTGVLHHRGAGRVVPSIWTTGHPSPIWRLTEINTKKSGTNVGKVFLITVPQVTKPSVWTKLTNVRSVRRFTRERTNWKFILSYPDPTAPHFQSLISLQPTKAFMRLFWCVSGIWGWEVFITAHKVILAATSPSQMGIIAFILRKRLCRYEFPRSGKSPI